MASGRVNKFRGIVNDRIKSVKLRERARLQCKLKKREAARKHRYIDVKIKNRALRPGKKQSRKLLFY